MLLVVFILFHCTYGLSKYIKSFQPVHYNARDIEAQHRHVRDEFHHRRKRRSLADGPKVEIEFNVADRKFELVLRGNADVFDDDYEVEDSQGHSLQHRIDHLVTGKIKNQPSSHCYGQLRNGVFSGVIHSPQWGTYYVERQKDKTGVAHSIIYHESEIEMPETKCIEMNHNMPNQSLTYDSTEMYHQPMEHHFNRMRREVDEDGYEEDQENTCILRIQVDHMFTSDERFQKQPCSITANGQRRCQVDRDEVINFISSHVRAINQIYIGSSFKWREGSRKVKIRPRFQVKRIKIDETTEEGDPFRSRNIGVEKFLEKASLANYDDYCLAYVFTKRDFQNGVLGLAWVAQPQGNSGGICEKNKKYTDGASKSLNTGIITIENYGSIVPEKVSHITFAHEIGHNFGSPHDDISCSPGESSDPVKQKNGNYIMYSRATAGDRKNNDKFSPCSYGNITSVLQEKRKCFVSSDAPICGNQIVDKNEECDCGFKEDCDKVGDKCCYPADHSEKQLRCKRRTNPATRKKYQCSPSEGPCCESSTCSFKGTDVVCSKELDCTYEQVCSGKMAKCPKPSSKENYSMCHKETMVCLDGTCSGSICLHHHGTLEPCECEVDEENASVEELKKNCHVCCRHKETGVCKSTGELTSYFGRISNVTNEKVNRTIFRQPGSPCNNFEGYCDVFSKCRSVDADGPLARLKKALFDPILYYSIREWIVEYWWAVLLMALALVMLMGAFIKICSLHTKSDNPNLVPHRDFPGTETLRRLHRQSARGRNYQANQHVQLNSYQG